MHTSAIELRSVSLRYGQPGPRATAALTDVSVEVEAGTCAGLIGGPGAGTTTLLLCAAGLVGADAGCVRWFGSHRWSAGRAAYARARADAHPYLSVRAWLEFAAALRADEGPAFETDVGSVLARTALTEFARIRVGHLTPGVAARVSLAGAMLGAPRIICFDRPFDELSGPERVRLAQVMASAGAEGITFLVAARSGASLSALAPQRVHHLVRGRVAPDLPVESTLELEVSLPIEARSRLALRVPSVYRRGRALRVPLERVTAEQVLGECRALGIDVRGSRVLGREEPSRRRVAEPSRS